MAKYPKPNLNPIEDKRSLTERGMHEVKHGIRKHVDAILIGVLVVLVLVLGMLLYNRRAQSRELAAWAALGTAENPGDLQEGAEKYSGTSAGEFLKLRYADTLTASSNSADLELAKRTYAELAESKNPFIATRARYSYALSLENTGAFAEAKKQWETLAATDTYTATGTGEDGKATKTVEKGFWARQAEEMLKTQGEREKAYAKWAPQLKAGEEANRQRDAEQAAAAATTATTAAPGTTGTTAAPATTAPATTGEAAPAVTTETTATAEAAPAPATMTETTPVATEVQATPAAGTGTNQ